MCLRRDSNQHRSEFKKNHSTNILFTRKNRVCIYLVTQGLRNVMVYLFEERMLSIKVKYWDDNYLTNA